MTYYVILAHCDGRTFATACDDTGVVDSDALLDRAKGVADHQFGHFVGNQPYTLELLAASSPPVIRLEVTP